MPDNAKRFKVSQNVASKLYIRINSASGETFDVVKKILIDEHGNIPVILYCTDNGKTLIAPKKLYCNCSKSAIERLKNAVGENNVKIVE